MNRYFQEVIDAHELISHWLGDETAAIEVCETLLGRFSPAYSMVTPGGVVLDFTALASFFRTQSGAKKGLHINIENMRLVAESAYGATVTYQERQQLPGQSVTLRFSTVVFESEQDGTVRWRHLHETFLLTS